MPLAAASDFIFGGVDSRASAINMDRDRSLRCRNYVPRQSGLMELRWGYSTATMSTVSASVIANPIPYTLWNGTRYLLFSQGTTWKLLNIATGAVTAPTVRGAAFSSSAKAQSYAASNHIHVGNGTDQKWFDGTTWRDSGLRALTATEVQSVVVSEGVRELTTVQAAAVTLTLAAGGAFPAAVNSGHLIYVAIFDTSVNEIGPATISVSNARVKPALNNKITVASLPDLSAVNANWVKLVGGTIDGGSLAWFFTNTSTVSTSNSRSGTTLTVIAAGHGLSTGDVVILSATGFDGVYKVTVSDVNTFTVTLASASGANTATGTVKRIVMAPNATTTVDVLAFTQDTSYQVNQDRGLPASTVGTSTPGYQFYASIYNSTAGLHVGNRIAIGGRFLQTGYRCNARLSGLPDLSGTDSEWVLLLGRTSDGAAVPYACADTANNWQSVASGKTTFTLTASGIDGDHELPTRNGIIPSQCNLFARVGDHNWAADTSSPTLRRSGSELDSRDGKFTGDPAQSWAGDDIETFPTASPLVGIAESNYELVCWSKGDCAILSDLAGTLIWRAGPWNGAGLISSKAFTKRGRQLFWVSADKQLLTFQSGEPTPISEEYEAALLSQISSSVELSAESDATKGIDRLVIKALDANGNPFVVYHDFKLIEPTRSIMGQGYDAAFLGPLANDFTITQVRDASGSLQTFAGATNGYFYQMNSGANDAGNEYSGDYITLLNTGPDRQDVPTLDWYGDPNLVISIAQNLSVSLTTGDNQFRPLNAAGEAEAVPAPDKSKNDSRFRVKLPIPEQSHAYIRFQLDSHSADGSLALNSPPHVPMEFYGRIHGVIASIGKSRGI